MHPESIYCLNNIEQGINWFSQLDGYGLPPLIIRLIFSGPLLS